MDDIEISVMPLGLSTQRKTGKKLSKRLIVFADGTGNAFGGQASNIWRLYQTMDKRGQKPLKEHVQLARYIPGVGTSSIGLVRLLDGATGMGVPANVQKLYRFLCWNWEPGDEIWMFGFSRGAFTVRTLAGLISSQGLMPKEVNGHAVSTAEMQRNSEGAWRAYRSATAPLRDPQSGRVRMSPTVVAGRFVRDMVVRGRRWVMRQAQHKAVLDYVKEHQPERAPKAVKIKFLGLFDTVEAYGVPTEELRSIFDFWIWPISFRNRVCSPIVEEVRHALSLDDERLTYHPLRFDQTPPPSVPGSAKPTNIKEVWFSGVHSDVGGGYPDDEAAFEPLIWMIEEAAALGLTFNKAEVQDYDDRRMKNALTHDSRSGLASAYRYAPRPVGSGVEFGGTPVVHSSVVTKLLGSGGGYAPVVLTDEFLPHDQPQQLTLHHDTEIATRVKALVLWRRVVNVAFISLLLFMLVFPWIDDVVRAIISPEQHPFVSTGLRLPDAIAGAVPGFVQPWLQSIFLHPKFTVPILLALAFLYSANVSLRDRIKDTSRMAWGTGRVSLEGEAMPPLTWREKLTLRTGKWIRSSRVLGGIYGVLSSFVVPFIIVCALLTGLIKMVHLGALTTVTAMGGLCADPGATFDIEPGQSRVLDAQFSPHHMCWSTGVRMVQGRTYWIRLEQTVPFTNNGTTVPMAGFVTNVRPYVLGAPLKRADAHWFQPIAQIGRTGRSIVALEEFSGNAPYFVATLDAETSPPVQDCAGAQAPELGTVTLTARLTAEAAGPLFLYANDSILWPWPDFYGDNGGCARVTIGAEASRL